MKESSLSRHSSALKRAMRDGGGGGGGMRMREARREGGREARIVILYRYMSGTCPRFNGTVGTRCLSWGIVEYRTRRMSKITVQDLDPKV